MGMKTAKEKLLIASWALAFTPSSRPARMPATNAPKYAATPRKRASAVTTRRKRSWNATGLLQAKRFPLVAAIRWRKARPKTKGKLKKAANAPTKKRMEAKVRA